MRYTQWLLVILAALLCVPTLQARRMKLMTYNIRHGEGTDRKYAHCQNDIGRSSRSGGTAGGR